MTEMSTKYNPTEVEQNRYNWWLEKEVFKADNKSKKNPYTIVIPPPNVTGKLHIGHAWDTTLQDMLTRYKRLKGFDVLYLPGMDHAGISTQAKVEAKMREEGISRYDLGREKFLERAWEWKEEYAGYIRAQWAKLGLSLDYDKERFTLDEGITKAVKKVFVDFYNNGLIYRGNKIINWDPVAMTALSNEEVIYSEEKGAFYHIKYKLENSDEYLDIATTRPELLPAIVAVFVNPKDETKQNLIGKTAKIPVVNVCVPILADEAVDMEKGTGIVMCCTFGDQKDIEWFKKYNLPLKHILTTHGKIKDEIDIIGGLKIEEARSKIVEELENAGALLKVEPLKHEVQVHERCGKPVEYSVMKQWFIDTTSHKKDFLEKMTTLYQRANQGK